MSVKDLTKEQQRTVTYWSNCIKEVAKSKDIDLQHFINELKGESDYESHD